MEQNAVKTDGSSSLTQVKQTCGLRDKEGGSWVFMVLV